MRRKSTRFFGRSPGVIAIGDIIVGIENSNVNVRHHQQAALETIFSDLESDGTHIKCARMDSKSYTREIVETVGKHSENFYLRNNRCTSLYDILLALRGCQRKEIKDNETPSSRINGRTRHIALSYSGSLACTVSRTYGRKNTPSHILTNDISRPREKSLGSITAEGARTHLR